MAMKLPIIDEKPCTPSKMPKVLSCFSGGAESLTAFRAAGQNAKPPVKQKPNHTMSCTVYTFANITLSMHKGRLANTDQKTIFFAENLSASQPPGKAQEHADYCAKGVQECELSVRTFQSRQHGVVEQVSDVHSVVHRAVCHADCEYRKKSPRRLFFL